jgi:hypothetical protein
MVTAVFTDNDDYARAYGLWQWDYGQQLRIEGLHLPTAVEIHFALQETGGEAITRVGTTKDGITTVTIPDSMLEGNGTAWTADKAYNIYAWVYLSDKSSGETIKRITMQVKSRPKPEAFEAPGDGEIFHEAIEAVNDAAKRAEEAGGKAVVAAEEAKAAATQTAEHLQVVQGLAEQVETNADTVAQDKQTVTGMLSQTQQAASDAALSAQEAKLSETAAAQAQTGAEAAEDTARQYAEETEADRQAVANDRQAVSQMREAVAADRQAVEQTAAQFGQTSQDALTAIGQAQSTAVGAVKAEGNKQTTAVQEAGTQAVKEVAEAKTTAVEAVTAEGDKQTKRVEDAAAGIVADREQINQNKTDIAGLVEGMTDLAPAIHSTASGSVITANDAAEGRPFRGLRVFGRTEQVRTTGAQLLDLSDKIGKTETKNGVTYIINDDQSITVSGKTGNYTSFYIKNMALKAGTYFLKNESRDKKIFIQLIGDTIKEGVFTLDKDVSNIGVYFVFNVFGGTVNIFNDTVTTMLNEGSTALPWEPYTGGKPSPSPEYPQEIVSAGESGTINVSISDSGSQSQSLTLATPNGLPGVPVSKDGNYTDADGQQWVCDEIDLERGKYVQRVVIENISGGWELKPSSDISGRFLQSRLTNTFQTAAKTAVCNIASFTSWGLPVNDKYAFALNTKVIYFSPPKGAEITAEELNAKLNSLSFPVVVVGELATPIERDLTPEEIAAYKALRTYGPTTVVSNDAGVHMEVTYVADTKAYIQNLEQRLSAKLVNIQSALISQKTSGGGGHLTIADSSPLPVEEFGMTGKTEQRKMSGKNLFDINSLKKYEVDNNDLKTSVDNDKIVLEGKGVTTTEVIFFCLNKTDDLLKLNPGKYTLSFKSNMPMGTAHKSKTVEAFAIIKKADGSSDYSSTGNKGWTTFDIAEGDMMYFRFDINNGTMTAEFYDIQLEYGSSVTAYEPYTGGQPSPSPDYPQSIELADQPITVTIKGGTESQSIILTPPRPFTKWDKLEKVNGVWCWVYQHKVLSGTEMAKNSSGLHTSGALMVNVSGLGIAENQDNSVCNKLICPTKSVASLAYGEFRILYGNIYLKIDGVTTIEEGRQWLESNDIIIIAQASAPEYIPLAASEQAQLNALTMYAGTTEITNNGGCTMDLTYTADTKTYIDNKLAAISAAVLEV